MNGWHVAAALVFVGTLALDRPGGDDVVQGALGITLAVCLMFIGSGRRA